MRLGLSSSFCMVVALLLIPLLTLPQDVLAQKHVVPAAQLHQDVAAAAQARLNHEATVRGLFSTEPGRKALKSANLSYEKVEKAVAQLSDEELARLAIQAEKVQANFAAGKMTTDETYILIAVVTAVIVLLIVIAARH